MQHREVVRRYNFELFSCLFCYVLILVMSIHVSETMPEGTARTLVVISPMVPLLFVVRAIARWLRDADEFVRKVTLESLAWAAAITACWTLTYGFLENTGFPRLSMFSIWPVMGATWGISAAIYRWRNR